MNNYLFGMELVKSNILTIEHKEIKRKHRQKRIQKKWIKRYGYNYFRDPDPKYYIFGNKIIGHEETLNKIIKAVESL